MTPDDALIEAIAKAQWNADANYANAEPLPWEKAQPWDRDWGLQQARAAYAALVEHLELTEETRQWGVMFNDGSVRHCWNGRTQRERATEEYHSLRATYPGDNIRLVSRGRLVSKWVEVQP